MPEHRPLDVKGAIMAFVLAVLGGANPVAIKLGLADVAPLRMAFFRFAVSAAVIFAYAMATGRRDILLIPRGHGQPIWSLGLLFVVQIALTPWFSPTSSFPAIGSRDARSRGCWWPTPAWSSSSLPASRARGGRWWET